MVKLVKITNVGELSLKELKRRIYEHQEDAERIMYQPHHYIKSIETDGNKSSVTIQTNAVIAFVNYILVAKKDFPCYLEFADITITDK